MALKECDKCSEMVDEAKAFCPGCGHAFVEEQTRSEASSFDAAESTVQLGQTMYDQMLSDMGLNTSKAPNPPEKRVEVIAPLTPLAPAAKPAVKAPDKPEPRGLPQMDHLSGRCGHSLLFVDPRTRARGFCLLLSIRLDFTLQHETALSRQCHVK